MAFAIARSETDVINNRAEDGHVFAAYRQEWKSPAKEMSFQSPTKEKASNQKSETADDKAFGSVLDGGAIGSLSLTKSVHSPNNSEELVNDMDEELPDKTRSTINHDGNQSTINRKFTVDNHVSIEFDPYGFTVKDLKSGTMISRHNSTGELYPFTEPTMPSSTALVTSSPDQWHNRLGHPGKSILDLLASRFSIRCNKNS
ncbi:hypothetical protein CASFOL_041967 [Castilleja foliolosa]|uniref:GAG-pre-integrase domain-containing protein n=1 Tax=Castilleja foliolosa TaxID=1961234 RepID=A0ABD3B9N7_9LAMI